VSFDEHEELCLFVGGPHDGERHKVRVAERVWTLARRSAPVLSPTWQFDLTIKPTELTVRTTTYVRTEWRAEWNTKYIYRDISLDPGQVLDMLIKGYREND
jgi:hypothetical protein